MSTIYQVDPYDIPKSQLDTWETLLKQLYPSPTYSPTYWILYAQLVGEWLVVEVIRDTYIVSTAQRLYDNHQPLTLETLKKLALTKTISG